VVDCLLDTSVIVDLIRRYPPAVLWIATQDNSGVTAVVWMEIIDGTRDKIALQRAQKVLERFERVEVTAADFDWAIAQQLRFRLSHNIGPNDCLIAAVSHRLALPLYTGNLKHFVPLLETQARQPY
jgi:predicted nucleic acid-binding protein